jgi:hypothetical protein
VEEFEVVGAQGIAPFFGAGKNQGMVQQSQAIHYPASWMWS